MPTAPMPMAKKGRRTIDDVEFMSTRQTGSWSELLSGKNGLRSLALSGGVALHAVNVYMVTTI